MDSIDKSNFFFRKALLVFTIAFFAFSFFQIFDTFAQSTEVAQWQNEISARNAEIAKLQAEIDSYNGKVANTKAEAKTLSDAIAKLEAQKKDLLNQISLTNLKIKNTEGNIFETLNKISEGEGTINESRRAIAQTLIEMKRSEDMNSFVLNLVKMGKSNFTEVVNNSYKLISLSETLQTKIDELNGVIVDLNENKSQYEKQKSELNNLSKNLNSREDLVAQSQKEQKNLLTQTKNQEKEYQKIIADRKAKVQALQDEVNSFEAKIKYILDKSKLPSAGALVWPLDKIVVTQYFGNTEFAASGAYNGKGHNGIDFGVAVGNPVYSAADGTVMGIGDTDVACKGASYGKWVLVKHDNGLATLYAHLSSISVSQGEKVGVKEQVGLSGNTGYSTGPHLHFSVFAADAVKIFGPTEYKSKTCGTYIVMPYAPTEGYLNPMNYLPK